MSGRLALVTGDAQCFHCGLEVPPGTSWTVELDGAPRPMCCPGCEAVARAIVDQGLTDYYRHRDRTAASARELVPDSLDELRVYDQPELQGDFVRHETDGRSRATLAVEGIRCAACAWLIERQLRRHPAVAEVGVNLGSQRAQLAWDPAAAALSELLELFSRIGYRARPFEPDREEERRRSETRQALRRLGVAGLGMMQVMMYAVALYAGALQGMEQRYRALLDWVSLLVATPVVLYAARPFFEGAARDLRARSLGMDVPVALAIGGAYLASAIATLRGTGTVYFDSVCMFTFFLLLGRFLEQQARQRADSRVGGLLKRAPRTARRITRGGEEIVPARALQVGDRVRVLAGETIPADGVVERGESAVDEALLTGEPRPRLRRPGDPVIGGGLNVESPIELSVQRAGAETVLAQIVALMDRAQSERPEVARTADRVARVFVGVLLLLAAVCFAFWSQRAPELAFPITLALLVASCPCALALATPAALTAAQGALAGAGLLVVRGHVIEGLSRLTDVVFDKTGTLTRGLPEGVMIRVLGAGSEADALARARLLEAHSEHPLAGGFARWTLGEVAAVARTSRRLEWSAGDLRVVSGAGVEGIIDGVRHRLGRAEWALEGLADTIERPSDAGEVDQLVLLASEEGPLAWFGLRDELRPEARALVEKLARQGIEVTLLSGDPSPAAPRLAERLGIGRVQHGASPADKRSFVRALQAGDRVVAMVGDGINDAPVLAQAQVSVAMGGGSDLARIHADAVLLEDDLAQLGRAIDFARRTRRIIRQNLAWALGYNATVLPLAASGALAPWAAAIGMSCSSLIVVGNALRLRRMGERG